MKVRVRYSIEDMDYRDVGDDLFSYPDETDVISCLRKHFETEMDCRGQKEWDHFLMMLETGKWLGGEWTRSGDTFKFNTDVAWYEYEVVGDDWKYDEDEEDRPHLEKLAEAIHDNSDGHDMLALIENYLGLIDPEEYKEKLEDYGIGED